MVDQSRSEEMTMKKLFVILAAILFSAMVSCSGGGSGEGDYTSRSTLQQVFIKEQQPRAEIFMD
jgi:hypothetical protein